MECNLTRQKPAYFLAPIIEEIFMPPQLTFEHGQPIWESPAIQVYETLGGAHLQDNISYELDLSKRYDFLVRFSNSGTVANNVSVQLYFTNPTTLGKHGDAVQVGPAQGFAQIGAGSTNNNASWANVDLAPIRTALMAGMPPNSDTSRLHSCLFAQVDCPDDPYSLTNDYWIATDRHVAQHNTDIVANPSPSGVHHGPGGGLPQGLAVGFHVPLQLGQAGDTTIRYELVNPNAAILERVGKNLQRKFNLAFAPTGLVREDRIGLQHGPQQLLPRPVDRGVVPRLGAMTMDLHRLPQKLERKLAFPRGATAVHQGVLWLAAQPQMRPGELYGVRVIREDSDHRVIGGLTIVVYQGPR